MSYEVDHLHCTIVYEILAPSGETLKRNVHRNITLTLGRNEFHDILLRMTLNNRDMKFPMKDITIHKKFAKDGKATVRLNKQNIQFMISNCPPDKLMLFLKALSTKVVCDELKPGISSRQRLLSVKSKTFQEISPLVVEEMQTLHELRAKTEEEKLNTFTPKGKFKRKRTFDEEKENWPLKVCLKK